VLERDDGARFTSAPITLGVPQRIALQRSVSRCSLTPRRISASRCR